jgi:hypothetical protein
MIALILICHFPQLATNPCKEISKTVGITEVSGKKRDIDGMPSSMRCGLAIFVVAIMSGCAGEPSAEKSTNDYVGAVGVDGGIAPALTVRRKTPGVNGAAERVMASEGGAKDAGANLSDSDTGNIVNNNGAMAVPNAGPGGSGASGGRATDAGGSTAEAAAGSSGFGGGMSGHNGATADSNAGTGGNGASGSGPDAGPEGGAGRVGVYRIMPLGDSITENTCYTQLLWQKLRATGHSNFDFVGSVKNTEDCGIANADMDCEGHSGYMVSSLAIPGSQREELFEWCKAGRADIVLMHLGTNDILNNIDLDSIINANSSVVDALRSVNSSVVVLVAQIIPLERSGCIDCDARAQALNALIPSWANSKSRADSPVYVIDLHTGFSTATDTTDGVHPNLAGAQKMVDGWYNALVAHKLF